MTPLDTPPPMQAKAILAALIAGLSALLPLLQDGFDYPDAIAALVAALIAYMAVFGMPNTGATPTRSVAALVDREGTVIAGPASPIPDGTPVAIFDDADNVNAWGPARGEVGPLDESAPRVEGP